MIGGNMPAKSSELIDFFGRFLFTVLDKSEMVYFLNRKKYNKIQIKKNEENFLRFIAAKFNAMLLIKIKTNKMRPKYMFVPMFIC